MPWMEIYRISGDESNHRLSQAKIQEMADNYDPDYREAPLVIGHPRDTKAPAWGWVKKLEIRGDSILALVDQMHDKVREIINKGLYKKISMAINTIKGKGLYLAHVGLLGAVQPAVAGMAEIALSAEDGQEITTRETDSWPQPLLDSLEDRRKAFNIPARQPVPGFKSIEEGGIEMEKEKIQALETELTELKANLAEATTEAEEKVKALLTEKEQLQTKHEELEQEVVRERETAWVETQIKEGKILPAWKEAGLVQFMLSLDDQEIVTKSADGKTQKAGQRKMFKGLVESLAAVIDFKELVTAERAKEKSAAAGSQQKVEVKKGEVTDPDMEELDKEAKTYMAKHPDVTYEKAIDIVKSEVLKA